MRNKIWIDLDNSPHVLFFDPIIRALRREGVEVIVTARDFAQVVALARMFRIEHRVIGHHYGKQPLMKVLGLLIRSAQLLPFLLCEKPDLCLNHGSRSQLLLAGLFGVPAVCAYDYEFSQGLPITRKLVELVPEALYRHAPNHRRRNLRWYPGIKEDVYVPGFRPDPSVRRQLGGDGEQILVAVRPPATVAHYFVRRSSDLFDLAIARLARMANVRVVLFPRTPSQAAEIRQRWRGYLETGRMAVADRVFNGLDVIWASDLVISGGGTMIREAAAMGVPAYSIFGGKIGAVDRYLAGRGRLCLLQSEEDIQRKLMVTPRRERGKAWHSRPTPTLDHIVRLIIEILKQPQPY